MHRREFAAGLAVAISTAMAENARGSVLASTGGEVARFRALHKSLWVWNVDENGLEELLKFAKKIAVDTVLLSLYGSLMEKFASGDAATIADLEMFKRDGRGLFALIGDPGWISTSRAMPEFIRQTLGAMSRHPGIFDGLSLDIEPNSLPQWQDPFGRQDLVQKTVQLFGTIRSESGGVPIDAALNPFFASIESSQGRSFLDELARHVDSVSLMAYRATPARAVEWARQAIAILDGAVLWRMGVLVNADPETGTSYFGKSRAVFQLEMADLDARIRKARPKSYAGLVFQDYKGLRAMLSG